MAHLADTLVTGASRGMGRATALALAFAGARVIVQYGRNADESQCGGRSMSAHPIFRAATSAASLGSGSNIVFVSSLGARAAARTLSAYASTKGAINTLVKYFAAALGPRGIRVDAVAPGVIDTDMSNLTETEEAHWITGDTIAVDGGSKL
jgi:NAD(P)-dependent dehydrogenase (short-subunit alcohol dehydrogenase family)